MTFNWPLFHNPPEASAGFREYCIIFDDIDDTPLLSRPRYLWFLETLPEAERQRKTEAARKQ